MAWQELIITDSICSYDLPDGSGNLYYNTETGYITDSDKTVQDVVIPAQIDGVKIVGIAPYAFAFRVNEWGNSLAQNQTLRSVSIPTTVEEIGKYAFYSCSKMSSLRFATGSQLKIIGERAFYCCESLTSLEIPNGVTEIGDDAFKVLSNLKNIKLSGTLDNEKWFGRTRWSKDDTLETATFTGDVVQYGVPAKKIIFADTVTEIGQSTFSSVSYLEEANYWKECRNHWRECLYGLLSTDISALTGRIKNHWKRCVLGMQKVD